MAGSGDDAFAADAEHRRDRKAQALDTLGPFSFRAPAEGTAMIALHGVILLPMTTRDRIGIS